MHHSAAPKKNAPDDNDCIFSFDNQFTQQQKNAILLLLQGLGDAQVARQIGVDRLTIYRWKHEDEFAAELQQQRETLWEHSIERLQSMLDPALEILQRQIAGEDPKTALRAAAILLRVATPAGIQRLTESRDGRRNGWSRPNSLFDALDACSNSR